MWKEKIDEIEKRFLELADKNKLSAIETVLQQLQKEGVIKKYSKSDIVWLPDKKVAYAFVPVSDDIADRLLFILDFLYYPFDTHPSDVEILVTTDEVPSMDVVSNVDKELMERAKLVGLTYVNYEAPLYERSSDYFLLGSTEVNGVKVYVYLSVPTF